MFSLKVMELFLWQNIFASTPSRFFEATLFVNTKLIAIHYVLLFFRGVHFVAENLPVTLTCRCSDVISRNCSKILFTQSCPSPPYPHEKTSYPNHPYPYGTFATTTSIKISQHSGLQRCYYPETAQKHQYSNQTPTNPF